MLASVQNSEVPPSEMKRQRNALGRHQREHHADVEEGLQQDHVVGDAEGHQPGEGIGGAERRCAGRGSPGCEQQHDEHCAREANFFGDVGEDEIGVTASGR
jgi:hypothetical protein